MKFTTTDNKTFRASSGYIPKNWIDYGFDDHIKSINKYFHDHIKVNDSDFCGSNTVEFLFEDDKAYRLSYEWWLQYENDDDDYFQEYLEIEEISSNDAKVPDRKIRNWI